MGCAICRWVKPGIGVAACFFACVKKAARAAARAAVRSSILGAREKAQSGGDLVVARAGGVQALAGVADDFDQAALDIKVDILVGFAPFEFAGIDFGFDFFESGANGAGVFGGDDFLPREHFGVGDRGANVAMGEAAVERHRGVEAARARGQRRSETRRAGGFFVGGGHNERAKRQRRIVSDRRAEKARTIFARAGMMPRFWVGETEGLVDCSPSFHFRLK